MTPKRIPVIVLTLLIILAGIMPASAADQLRRLLEDPQLRGWLHEFRSDDASTLTRVERSVSPGEAVYVRLFQRPKALGNIEVVFFLGAEANGTGHFLKVNKQLPPSDALTDLNKHLKSGNVDFVLVTLDLLLPSPETTDGCLLWSPAQSLWMWGPDLVRTEVDVVGNTVSAELVLPPK